MDIEFQALLDDTLSIEAQEKLFAEAVEEIKQSAKQIDEEILGHPVDVTALVIAPLSVELDFLISDDVLGYVAQQLNLNSPVGANDKHPGKYLAAHVLYADGVLVADRSKPPQAKIYTFVNGLPYAEKIEAGESSQAPNGVYEVTANEAQKRFPSMKIEFVDYLDSIGKYPAIQVTI